MTPYPRCPLKLEVSRSVGCVGLDRAVGGGIVGDVSHGAFEAVGCVAFLKVGKDGD